MPNYPTSEVPRTSTPSQPGEFKPSTYGRLMTQLRPQPSSLPRSMPTAQRVLEFFTRLRTSGLTLRAAQEIAGARPTAGPLGFAAWNGHHRHRSHAPLHQRVGSVVAIDLYPEHACPERACRLKRFGQTPAGRVSAGARSTGLWWARMCRRGQLLWPSAMCAGHGTQTSLYMKGIYARADS